MIILSPPQLMLVGSNPIAVRLPAAFPNINLPASFVVVMNIGAVDCNVTIGNTPGIQASASSQAVAASQAPQIPGYWRNLTTVAIGSLITLPINTDGPLYASAIATPAVIDAGVPQVGTADQGSTTISLVSAEGIEVGMFIAADGIPAFSTVTAINDTTITISAETTAALSAAPIDFGSAASPAPPGLLLCALAM